LAVDLTTGRARIVRRWFFFGSAGLLAAITLAGLYWPGAWWGHAVAVPLVLIGLRDAFQSEHTVLRNFPLIGHGRYCMELVRPEIQQYFIESNTDAYPVERELRSVVYQRAKAELETRPFGTQRDVYQVGYEWASHSLAARHAPAEAPRIDIGGPDCTRPYAASLFNISAMSFGALSDAAVLALNRGAKAGGFAHNTGEGGLSRHHLAPGGDLIWQLGTAYFGCRTPEGGFDPPQFADKAAHDQVRMIELKLSQGAKPGHGGILPGAKVSAEIAEARGVPQGQDVVAPPSHSTFDSPIGLLEFIARLRELAGGKPVGFKLCVGRRTDFYALCKAMRESGITPDFITVDGGEGGTAAAPLEFSNYVGMPARDAWVFAHNALVGTGLRTKVKLIASGKIMTGFDIVRALALGADLCASARGMMFALGCIQSLRCNTNRCPTGITTQDPRLVYGLHVADKSERVRRYHQGTVRGALELVAAMGLEHTDELRPHHIFRRVDHLGVRNLAELYELLSPGQLVEDQGGVPAWMATEWRCARADRWSYQPESGHVAAEAEAVPATA